MNALVKPHLDEARVALQVALSSLKLARKQCGDGYTRALDDQVIATAIAGVEHALLSLSPERIAREARE